MTRLSRLSTSQRVVVIVGLGAALYLVGAYVTSLGEIRTLNGWVAYAPLSNTFNGLGGMPGWAQLVVWLALVIVWVLGSVRILHRRAQPGGEGDSTNPPAAG